MINDFSKAGCLKKAKSDALRSICEEVAAVSSIPRTEKECQRIWQIIKSEPREKPKKQREAMTTTGKS